jgi:hypothetical protein
MNFANTNLLSEAGLRTPNTKQAERHGQGTKRLPNSIATLIRKVELGDVLLFFYVLALIRQYFWPVGNNLLAWVLSFSIALSLWCFGLSKKDEPTPGSGVGYSFYLIVALPLFVIYASRVVFPDISFDVLNYHLLEGERSLRGWPSGPSDFFLLLNPLPDMVTGIYRHVLGYRMGTLVNYLTLLWVARILVEFLRAYLRQTWVMYLAVLLILLTETMLFEINNYMVDLLAVPLLLQATSLVLRGSTARTIGFSQFYIALLLGMSVALKLTNIIFVAPIMAIWIQRLLTEKFELKPLPVLLLLLILVALFIPHSIHLRRVGAPVPFSRVVVQSPLAFTTLKEARWGPIGLKQAFIWPLLLYSKAQRLSEFHVYAGKIPLGFVIALFLLPFRRVDRDIRALSFIMVAGAIFWSLATGYPRYASFLELISGILIIYLAYFVAEKLQIKNSFRRPLQIIPWLALAVVSSFSLYYVYYYEWSLRPTLFNYPSGYLRESKLLFRDYSLKSFIAPAKAAAFDDVEVWIRSSLLTSCFEGLLKPEASSISLPRRLSMQENSRIAKEIQELGNKRMYSICYLKDLKTTSDFLAQRGLGTGKITTIVLPYYSHHTVYNLALIEVLPTAAGRNTVPSVVAGTAWPLPISAFQAEISSPNPPAMVKAGVAMPLYVTIKNLSTINWPGASKEWKHRINLGNHWLDMNGTLVTSDDGRTALPFDLKPGDEIELPLTITPPLNAGNYILEIDLVQEQVGWFGAVGSKTLKVNIKVE